MGKLFLSIRTILAGVIPAKAHRGVAQREEQPATGIRSGRTWILLSALIAATGGFTWLQWQASTKVTPPQGVWANIDNSILRLSGSKTIGAALAPELAKAWLASIGASDIEVTHRVGRDGKQIPEFVISAKLNGNPVVVDVKARGSASAFADLAASDADIGIASREINASEVTRLMPLGDMRSQASEHVLGLEGIAVIVPHSNTIPSLSRSTLKKIFTGQITDWSAVGMKHLPIHLYARDKDSRTNEEFASLVLGGDPMADAKRYDDNAKLESDVAADPGGIGFAGVPYVKDTRPVSISEEGAAPPGRQLYLYNAAAPRNPAASDFVRFAMSPEGQEIVRQARFVEDSEEASGNSNGSAAIASLRDNLKVSISADRAEGNLPVPPPKFAPPVAATPAPATGPSNAPPRPPAVTASLQAPPPPAITASLQAPAPPGPQATPPATRPPPPPLPAPARPAPPVVSVAPLPAPAPPQLTAPVAINSHAVTASDYPAISIRLQEQGTVVIKYLVRQDGSVGDCKVTTPSGQPALDDAACTMVKRRWKFRPATQDGKPVAAFLTADIAFRLGDTPTAPRPTILASLAPRPAPAPVVKAIPDPRLPVPPVAITDHAVTINDYPRLLRTTLQEQGTVAILYLVKEDGSVGDCTVTASSGIPLLDDAACTMVKRRWRFKPATQEGKPIAQFLTADVVFKLK